MTKTLLGISVIAGIAGMLSMTMMPASASPVDNNCRFDAETLKTYCRAEIKVGQVIQFNQNEETQDVIISHRTIMMTNGYYWKNMDLQILKKNALIGSLSKTTSK